MRLSVSICVAGALIGLGVGCTKLLTKHCANLRGDQTCVERGTGSFCSSCVIEVDGCSDQLPSEACHFSGVEVETTSEDMMSEGMISEGSTRGASASEGVDEGSTGSTGSTTGGGCTSQEECLGTTPFCNMESGECVPCSGVPDSDAACAEADPRMPRCVDDVCVGCTEAEIGVCDQQLWACDFRTGSCFSCAEHHQCTSGACDIFMGTCFDPEMVIEVGGGGDGPSTIAEGLAELAGRGPDGLDSRRGVLVLHDGADFDEAVDLEVMGGDAEAIAIVAAPGESPTWVYTDMIAASATLTIGAMTRAYLDGVVLRGNTNLFVGQGLVCDSGRVDIRRSSIVDNGAEAIQALGSCELHVENSFIGADTNDQLALYINGDNVMATILYSTLGAGEGAYARALYCNSNLSVVVRNSLLVAQTASSEVQCDSAVLTNSVMEAGGLGFMNVNWFRDYAAGDYHLTGIAPIGIQAANWQPGDPTTDIDGNPRATSGDEHDHAGADVPVVVR